MSTELVSFEGEELLCIKGDGQIFIPIRPIAERIGLHVDSSIRSLQDHPILSKKVVTLKIEDKRGRMFPQITLPLEYFNGWLFGIEVSRVKEEVRPKLMLYQEKCYDVLYQYFFGKLKAIEQIEGERFRLLQSRRSYEGAIMHAKKEIKKIDYVLNKLDVNIFGQLALCEVRDSDRIDLNDLENYYVDHEQVV